MAVNEVRTGWKVAAVLLFGIGLGTILVIPVLFLAGIVVMLPGVHSFLSGISTSESEVPLMLSALVFSWALGVLITYGIITRVLASRDTRS